MLALAVGLAMDAFAVAISIGLALPSIRPGHLVRAGLAFGGFQALMPIIGWLAGSAVAQYDWVAAYDHWIAFTLLAGLGMKMIYEARFLPDESREGDPTVGLTLVTLAIATSIDALAGGLSLAMVKVKILTPSLVIGITAALFAMGGLLLGRRLGKRMGSWAEVLGGVALIGIGARILIEHLLAG